MALNVQRIKLWVARHLLIVQSRFQSIFIFKVLIFFRAVFLEKKQRDVGFSLCCFTVAPTQNQSCSTMKNFLVTSSSCFYREAEIHVMVGKKDGFCVREVWLYYHKGRAATEFIGVHYIFPPFDYTLGGPRVPLLENIYSAHSKTLTCWLYSSNLFK